MEGGQGSDERAVLDLDDPKLEEKLVSELKAQGVFDQFRKDCLSDVDTKPAYQNLRVRVDKSVSAYLDRTTWRSTLNKNQLRNQLRKYIQEMSGVEAGVDRIVDQIVNPAAMEAEVESVIYRYFGTTKEVEEAKEQEALANGGGVLMEEEEEEIKPATLNGEVGEHHGEEVVEPASEAQEEFSQASSPGPDMAALSPLTPQDSPTVPQGDISPITPKQSPETMEVDSPPRPPSAYTPPPRPTESFTPPPPPTQILGLGKAAPPQAPILLPPPPPPPAASDSGGEASMSSISDTDLGEVSPPQPRRNIPEVPATVPLPPSPSTPPAPAPPPSATPPPPGEASDSGEGSDLGELERMKAELLAQLEGDFKISPEESESEGEEGEEVKGSGKEAGGSGRESGGGDGDSPNQLQRMRNLPRPSLPSAAAMSPRSPSASPSPPPPTQRLSLSSSPPGPPRRGPTTPPPCVPPPPPEAAMESMTLESSTTPTGPSGCQPFSDRGRSSGSSPDDEGGRGGRSRGQEHLSIPLPPLPPPPASTQASSSVAQGSSSGGEGEQKRAVLHSSSSSSTSSTSSSSSSSTPSSSKHRDRKHDRKHEKAIKEKEKAKIEKYDQKVKSKDKLKSDKFQDLDIFSSSKTKTPVTPYQPHRLPGQSLGKNGTPTKEGERKLDEKLVKEKQSFKTPGKVEERRRSSSNSESKGKEKERRHSSSSSSHSQSKDRHRHESKERRHSKDEERRHSKDEKRSSTEKEERKSEEKKLAEEIKRAGDKERERLLRLYSSEGGTEDADKKEKKYEKEREQQALESKKRLQESRERKEKEERAEKERKRLKEKERREKERRLEKEREAKEERARKERLEENKNAVKEKIQTLQPEELKMVLLESIVAKEGGNLDETQRKDVLRTLESAIVGKVVEKKKSPGKNGRRSRVRGGDSSDDDFTPAKAKRLTSRRKVDSESDSCSNDSDSDSGIKALKSRIADRRKSTEELVMQSRKSPDTSTTSSRKSFEDSTASSSKVSDEKSSRKSRPDQVKTSPKEPVESPKSKSSPIKPQLSPVKSQKSPGTQLPSSPSKLTPKPKQVAVKKQEASGSKSKQGRAKAKVLPVDLPDDDPTVEPLEAFKQSDIEFMLHMKDLYGRKLEKGIDAISISSVTSSELNLAIPATRTVTIDVEEEGAGDLVRTLAGYGGNPRLFTAVPSWLAPHLEASRVKEEVEMPTKQEIADYLVKKNKASKRKAGWDIVVEVVPTGPQPKRSKLEIQLGYDSAFAESLTLSGGRRSRRPNKRYSDGADDSTSHEGKSNLEAAPSTNSNLEVKATNELIKTDAEVEVENTEEAAGVSESKIEVDQSVETVEEEEIEKSLESNWSNSEESLKLELVDTDTDTAMKVDTSVDTEMENEVEGVVPKEEKVAEVDTVSQTATSQESSVEDSKKVVSDKSKISPQKSVIKSKEAPKSKELASLLVESNLVVNELPQGQVRELRKRKVNSSANNCKGVEEEDFHGWAAPPPAPRTGWKLLGAEGEEDCTLEEVGATFGFVQEDVLILVEDQNQSQMMEVVMSPPMIQDTKRVEREDSTGNTKIVAFPESDQEERGSQSPSSFGSSKENVPEICNNTLSLQKGCPNISKRRRSNKNPVLKTNTVV